MACETSLIANAMRACACALCVWRMTSFLFVIAKTNKLTYKYAIQWRNGKIYYITDQQ